MVDDPPEAACRSSFQTALWCFWPERALVLSNKEKAS